MMQRLSRPSIGLSLITWVAALLAAPPSVPAQDVAARPMRIIVFGAHPDDCELEAAGTAALGQAGLQGQVRQRDQRRHRPP